ncbi:MAG TPA: acyl-CoA dehydrogenase family protein [Candidimonas sp.]|nr:acyl-CoA dehydrogenase family protein [Candidimonas sp.]
MPFGPEHLELRRSLDRFIATEINPYVAEWEDAEQFPSHELFKKAGNAGFLGISKPVEYGGMGLDYSYSTVWAEALGTIHCGGVASAIGVQTDMCTPALANHGSDELRREFLAPTIAGDIVGCIGVSETGAGSDVASIKTFARRDGDDYIINGGKMWISNGIKADWMCLLANTSNDNGPHRNKSLIVLPMNTKGIQRDVKLRKLGLWCSDTAQIFFDDVRVPSRYVIGEEGMGFVYQMEQFAEERLFAAARTVSQMEGLVIDTIDYTRSRQAFGKPLLDNQWIHYTLSDLYTEVEALRALTYSTVDKYVAGEDVRLLTAMAKLKAGKLVRTIPDQCLQFWGGAGYLWESKVSRMMRDSRLVAIGGGANEVMMAIISKELGILPGRKQQGDQ